MGWSTLPRKHHPAGGRRELHDAILFRLGDFSNRVCYIEHDYNDEQVVYLATVKDNHVSATVMLVDWTTAEIRYKLIHESEGPLWHGASRKFLDTLDPPEGPKGHAEYAIRWRNKCLLDKR